MNRIWDFGTFGRKAALIDDTGVTVRYDELEMLQNELSKTLDSGRLTMMLCENSIGALSGYAALLNGGFPMLMVSAALPEEMRRQIMNTYRPGLVFAPRSLRDDYPHLQELRTIDDYVLLRTSYPELYPIHPALGQLLTTSGSTGSVKFVRQSWDNIRINSRVIAEYLGMTDAERTITALPLNYTYALSVIGASLTVGGAMIVTDRGILDEEFWDLFENEHVTVFHGVSNTYDMLYRMDLFCEDFPDLRLMTQAGSRLSRELHRTFAQYAAEYGKRFVVMYGQCEATAAVSYLPAEKALEKPGSVGIAVPEGKITLINTDGNPVEEVRVPGELVYRGGNVALGYAACGQDLSRGDDWQGELHTGDLAERDEDGFLYITGRLKRFIKVSGHRVSLDEIDERIMNDIHIRSVSSGTDDHLVIFVLNDEDRAAVQDYVRQKISVVRPVFQVVRIDDFPTNEAGKLLYGALLETAKQYIG
ncbi:MAG: AMP-binding protein [Oscillospiraceae bacterium]|nr:AMP-binding protein [Oscillospiraceae bacterium]